MTEITIVAPRSRTMGTTWLRHVRGAFSLLVRAVGKYQRDQCLRVAAAIAYHVLFAIVPLVALLVAVFGLLLHDPVVLQRVVRETLDLLPLGRPENQRLIVKAVVDLRHASGPLTVGSAIALAWGALGLFDAMRWGINRVWGADPRGLLRQKLMDVAYASAAWMLLVLSLALSTAMGLVHDVSGHVLPGVWIDMGWGALEWLPPVSATFAAFVLVYRFVPHVQHRVRDVWPAALVVTILFELAKHVFGLTPLQRGSVLGALGGVMLFMLWAYVSAAIMLFGAELAVVTERARQEAASALRGARNVAMPEGSQPAAAVEPPRDRGAQSTSAGPDVLSR